MPKSDGDENLKGAVCYLFGFITGILMLLLEKKSAFVRFHAMQSTIVFGAIFILNIFLGVVPVIGWIVGLLLSPISIFVSFILWIFLMWKAFQGEKYKLPYVGDIAEAQLAKLK